MACLFGITWTNAGLLLIGPFETHLSVTLMKLQQFP